jgi:uncharacterized protein (TIGR00255 family)
MDMIQSMTGFGSASGQDFTVEIRSLNHRFIDIGVKIPPHMNQHDVSIRNILKKRFQRGRFDVSLTPSPGKTARVRLDRETALSVYSSLRDLQEELALPGQISIDTLAGYRELLVEENAHVGMEAFFTVFDQAVTHLEHMRMREGKMLSEELRKRLKALSRMNRKIKKLAPSEVKRWRRKFTERLQSVLNKGAVTHERVLQEAAIMADKLDISEELNRIDNHLIQFGEILGHDTIVGKKLDFLLQELMREVNTLAYKSGNYTISHLVVEMKTEVEKMREQVQNLQ